jgi:L-ascorbate metabolism protein UlaG (beta-lactamase superfamily)
MNDLLRGVSWLGHASFRIVDGATVYIDPWQLDGGPQADVILVTHGHHDHLSPSDIALIAGPQTQIVGPAAAMDEISDHSVHVVRPGDKLRLGEVTIQVVPAYNTDKPNHPQSAGHVGYIVDIGGRLLYHAGDTDVIPEMQGIVCDVALLPMGGKYTMDAAQAAEAAALIKPRIVVPMHWGRIIGSREDVQRMEAQMPEGVQLVVLEPESST